MAKVKCGSVAVMPDGSVVRHEEERELPDTWFSDAIKAAKGMPKMPTTEDGNYYVIPVHPNWLKLLNG